MEIDFLVGQIGLPQIFFEFVSEYSAMCQQLCHYSIGFCIYMYLYTNTHTHTHTHTDSQIYIYNVYRIEFSIAHTLIA